MAWIIESGFTPKQALSKLTEMMGMDEAALTAEMEGIVIPRGLTSSPKDFAPLSMKVDKVKKIYESRESLDRLRQGKSWTRFFGDSAVESKTIKHQEQILLLGDPYQAARWFYRHPRIVLIGAMRDKALGSAYHADADWVEVPDEELKSPVCTALQTGEWKVIKEHIDKICGPLSKLDPTYVLTNCDGLETVSADLTEGRVRYYSSSKPELSV